MGSQRGRDPRGYYRTLCVDPGASAAQIKAAYRSRAMALHPDRNPERDTTAQFQALQAAYAVLSDAQERELYDADSIVHALHAEEEAPGSAPFYAPIHCSHCHKVTAQPRYQAFYTVYGWVWGTTRKTRQGIFCAECALLVGLRATATTLLAGWWSLRGTFWSCHALYANFSGGRFYQQNAKLMGYLAMYLAHVGKITPALAAAAQAMAMIDKATGGTGGRASAQSAVRPQDAALLAGLAQSLTDLIDAFASPSARVPFKSKPIWCDRYVLAQGALTLGFSGLVLAGGLVMLSTNSHAPETVGVIAALQVGVKTPNAPAAGTGPLGYRVGSLQNQALNAPAFALPPSGVYWSADLGAAPGNTPSNQSSVERTKNYPPLKVINPIGSHNLLKLVRLQDGAQVLSVFIRSGDTVEVGVPPGSYQVKVASGQIWYGEPARFGEQTRYLMLTGALIFTAEGGQLLGQEINLSLFREPDVAVTQLRALEF